MRLVLGQRVDNPGCAANAATLGCGMQRRWRKNRLSASECTNLSQETQATQQAYGLNDKVTAHFGRNCLLARRLVERGVRFIQLYSGGNDGPSAWDAHDDLKKRTRSALPRNRSTYRSPD